MYKNLHFLLIVLTISSCNLFDAAPPKEITVSTVSSKAEKFENLKDSLAYLKIQFLPNAYEVKLFDKKLTTKNVAAIDSFIQINKAQINKNKVLLIDKDSLKTFDILKPILIKHEIIKFQVDYK